MRRLAFLGLAGSLWAVCHLCGVTGQRIVTMAAEAADGAGVTPVNQRLNKCAYLWQQMAPWSYKPEIVAHFISEHERRGIGDQWFASFVYGFANFGLRLNAKAPGGCYGPMDVKWSSGYGQKAGCVKPDDLRDWRKNITAHCIEARVGVKRGHRGLALCKYIMYPARPHDWGGGRFRNTWEKAERQLRAGYRAGKL